MLLSLFRLADKLDVQWQDLKDLVQFGQAPRPIYFGKLARWRETDVQSWLSAGCPPSAEMNDDEDLEFLGALVAELREKDQTK